MKKRFVAVLILMLTLICGLNINAYAAENKAVISGKVEIRKSPDQEMDKVIYLEEIAEDIELIVMADENVYARGTCGENLTWKLTKDGTLTISGTGEMEDMWWESGKESVWKEYIEKVKYLVVEEGVVSIGNGAFLDYTELVSVEFPSTLEVIGNFAFMGCTNVEKFELPEGITSVGQQAFDDCDKITSFTIPKTVTYIGGNICRDCDLLKEVYIDGPVQGEGDVLYIYADNPIGRAPLLEKIEVHPEHFVFESIEGVLYDKTRKMIVQYPNGKAQESYSVVEGTEVIFQSAFWGLENLKEINFPDSVIKIEDTAIYGCRNLKSITIPASVEEMGAVIRDCANLEYIDNKSSVPLTYNVADSQISAWFNEKGDVITEITNGRAYVHRKVREITVSETMEMDTGTTEKLAYDFEYYIIALDGIEVEKNVSDLIFTSSDESVVKVSDAGELTAVGAGTAEVMVAAKAPMEGKESVNATCTVTVTAKGITQTVTLNKTELSLEEGQEETLVATVTPAGTPVTWTSDNESVATVDENGAVTANGEGTAVITVTTPDGTSASCTLTVKPASKPEPDEGEGNEEAEQVENFAERMYTVVLDREADPNGLSDWTNLLLSHEIDGAGIAQGFIMSEEFTTKELTDEEFVDILYETFFDRAADVEGKNTWMGVLAEGKSRESVLAGFVNSGEFDTLCDSFGIVRGIMREDGTTVNPGVRLFAERLYNKVLDREGEKAGLEDWTGWIAFGEYSAEDAAKLFFESDEFKARELSNEDYVETLYQTFMGRASDAEGKAMWVKLLNEGMTRNEVLEGFSRSTEFSGILDSFGL